MSKFSIFHLLLVSLAFTFAFSALSVLNPPKLQAWWNENSGATHTSVAAFGYIPWGRKVMGTLSLADPLDACEYIKQTTVIRMNPILVAKRGNCTFVTKAHYAQLAGAKMLIIVDDNYEEVENHLMVDNMGQGESVNIPTILLAKTAGDKLILSLQSSDTTINTINVVFDFTVEKAKDVKYNVWLSSATPQSFKFINEWKTYEHRLSHHATMTPHYCHFSSPGHENDLAGHPDCICGGRYCAPDPDDERNNTGTDVLIEDLRQICLYKNYPDLWWKYLEHYDSFCLVAGDMDKCGRNAIADLGIDYSEIQDCIDRSFDNKDLSQCTRNKFFDEEQKVADKEGIFMFPSVTINGYPYRGSLVPSKGVFEAICETFDDMPAVCKHYLHVSTTSRSYVGVVVAALAFLILFTLFVFCCYRRYLKRELHKQMVKDVNIAVSQYLAFKEQSLTGDKSEDASA